MINDCGFCEHLTRYVTFEKDKTTGRTKEKWKMVCKKHDEVITDFEKSTNCDDYEDIFANMFQWRK